MCFVAMNAPRMHAHWYARSLKLQQTIAIRIEATYATYSSTFGQAVHDGAMPKLHGAQGLGSPEARGRAP